MWIGNSVFVLLKKIQSVFYIAGVKACILFCHPSQTRISMATWWLWDVPWVTTSIGMVVAQTPNSHSHFERGENLPRSPKLFREWRRGLASSLQFQKPRHFWPKLRLASHLALKGDKGWERYYRLQTAEDNLRALSSPPVHFWPSITLMLFHSCASSLNPIDLELWGLFKMFIQVSKKCKWKWFSSILLNKTLKVQYVIALQYGTNLLNTCRHSNLLDWRNYFLS